MTDKEANMHRLALAGLLKMMESNDSLTSSIVFRMTVLHLKMMEQYPLDDSLTELAMLEHMEALYDL